MLVEAASHVYIGDQDGYEQEVRARDGWAVVQACKEPYHREALGYRQRGAPKNHPEYLYARRDDGRRLILNLVDAADPAYVPGELFDVAHSFIADWRDHGADVLVHCNQGLSRSPAIVLAYLVSTGELPAASLDEAEQALRRIHPSIALGRGVRGFLDTHWSRFATSSPSGGSR